jgi:hypothetical protein
VWFTPVVTDAYAAGAQSAEVCSFFEMLCGSITRLHLTKLDNQDAQVAFVEFVSSASAERALSCGGARIRVRLPFTACARIVLRRFLSS